MRKDYGLQEGRVVDADGEGVLVVFLNPSDEEKRYLIDSLKIDEHTLASALDPDELSRLEFEPEHAALIVKQPKNYSGKEQFLFHVNSMGLFLFKDRLVIVVSEADPFVGGRPFTSMNTLNDVMLRLVNRCTVHFLEHLKVINMVSDELEQKINEAMENRYLINLFSLEKSLVYYLNAIHTNGVLITKLKNNVVKLGISQEQSEFLDDISVENEQCYRLAEIYSNVLASLMDARASLVSNNLNVMMKNLNAIVIAVAVPSFFAGMGGMSEFSMIAGPENWMIAYPAFLACMFGIGLGTFFVIRKIERYWR